MSITYIDLIERFGETETIRTIEVLEAVAAHAANLDRLAKAPEERFVTAMQSIIKLDFAA